VSEFTATIDKVVNINGRYEVTAGGRKLSTFKEDIARKAMSLEGSEAVIGYTTQTKEKDGRTYTNTYLDSVQAAEPDLPEIPVQDSNEQRRKDIRWQAAFNNAKDLVIAETDGKSVNLEAVFALADVIFAGMSRRQG